MKTAIQTREAPEAIGTYSQAVRVGDTVYLSGQIALDPASMQLAEGIEGQTHRVFRNLAAVAAAAGLGLEHCVRMTVYLTDLAHFARVNEIMAQYVREPYPSRAAVGVAGLPRGALVEIDAILHAGGGRASWENWGCVRASTSSCTCPCATKTRRRYLRPATCRRAATCWSTRALTVRRSPTAAVV